MASGKGADCGRIRKEKGIRGGDEAERSRKGARIRRVLEDERRQDKTSNESQGLREDGGCRGLAPGGVWGARTRRVGVRTE